MATRFIGKNIHKRVIRPLKNSVKYRNYVELHSKKEDIIDEIVVVKKEQTEEKTVNEKKTKKENNRKKEKKDMINETQLSQLETIAGTSISNDNVKFEKADKGLFERTENSTILLTEDNKMLLTD